MSLNSTILSVTRRTVKGFTVGEIFDRVQDRLEAAGKTVPPYNSVRARVYELATAGQLNRAGARRDPISNRTASVFTRN